jgi:hypothetical protein
MLAKKKITTLFNNLKKNPTSQTMFAINVEKQNWISHPNVVVMKTKPTFIGHFKLRRDYSNQLAKMENTH